MWSDDRYRQIGDQTDGRILLCLRERSGGEKKEVRFSSWGGLLLLLVLVDLFLQFYTKSVDWGTSNSGFSFGLANGLLPAYLYLFPVGLLFALAVAKRITGFGWLLIIVGGLSNGLSRVVLGSVWDYLHWDFLFSLWFNLADVSITLGVVWQIGNYRSSGRTKTSL